MKIGIYGGSFNPIHFGHIGLARWVVEHTDIEQLWMMVSPNNPLKDSSLQNNEQERLDAVREAVEAQCSIYTSPNQDKRIIVSDFEFGLPRPSYTANTLRALSKTYPEHEFTLIIGEDNLAILPQWREWEYIVRHYRIMVYPRHNAKSSDKYPIHGNILYLADAPYFDISSTEIRQKKA